MEAATDTQKVIRKGIHVKNPLGASAYESLIWKVVDIFRNNGGTYVSSGGYEEENGISLVQVYHMNGVTASIHGKKAPKLHNGRIEVYLASSNSEVLEANSA